MAGGESWSFEAFGEAGEAWDDLVASCSGATPFLTHVWLRTWWAHFGSQQQFHAVVVREGDRLLAAVPLGLRSLRFAGRRVVLAEIVGTAPVPTRGMGLADKADFLVRDGCHDALAALCRDVATLLGKVDLLDIKGFDADSPTVPALADALPAAAVLLERSSSPYLALEGGWETYLRSRSQKFRKNLKRSWRKLGEHGQAEVRRLEAGDDAGVWMAHVMEVDGATWKAERGTNLFRHPALRAFYEQLIPELAARELLDLHLLQVEGRPIAYELGFDLNGRIVAYNAGYRSEYAEASPGTVVAAAVVESACERGRVEYDMGRGAAEYKARWSSTSREQRELLLPTSTAGRFYAWAGLRLKRRLKRSRLLVDLADRLSGWSAGRGR